MTLLITILCDETVSNIPLVPLLRKLPPDQLAIVTVPSTDYDIEYGVHVSPSLNHLLSLLIPRRKLVGQGFRLNTLFKRLGFKIDQLTDFELAVSMLLSLWLKEKTPLLDFYGKISSNLGIPHQIFPLLDPPPSLVVETTNGSKLFPYQMVNNNIEKIEELVYYNLDKAEIISETKKILVNSDIVLLFQLSALSMYFLKSIGSLKKILENYKGTILYILPDTITNIDMHLLSILGYSGDLYGLVKMAHEQVDAIIFDEKDHEFISNLSEIKLTFYPVPYKFQTTEDVNAFIEHILKVLQ